MEEEPERSAGVAEEEALALASGGRGATNVAFTRGNPQLEVQSGTLWLFEAQPVEEVCVRHGALQRSDMGVLEDVEDQLGREDGAAPFSDLPQTQTTLESVSVEPVSLPDSNKRGPLLAILSVPAHLIPTDLLQFLAPVKPHIRSACVLRHCISSTQYLVLVRMEDQTSADEAYIGLHKRPFSGLERYLCYLAFARGVSFDTPVENQNELTIPEGAENYELLPPSPRTSEGFIHTLSLRRSQSVLSNPIPIKPPVGPNLEYDVEPMEMGEGETKGEMPPPPPILERPHSEKALSLNARLLSGGGSPYDYASPSTSLSASLSGSNPLSIRGGLMLGPGPPSPPHQLNKKSRGTSASEQIVPTCVVCLEIMDGSVPQVFTTVCNHSFHMDCLGRWENSPCPVCRFHPSRTEEMSRCAECGCSAGLWCCLLCGYIGCGKQGASGHIRAHYLASLHTYVIELDTQHVWDFAGDGFVHRLVHSKSDGKLVEVPDPQQASEERSRVPELTDAEEEEMMHQKLEGLAYQYNTMVTQLLDDQRQWYQHQLSQILEERDKAAAAPEGVGRGLLDALRAERRSALDRCQAAKERLDKARDEGKFLQELNGTLLSNEDAWNEQLTKAQQEMSDAVAAQSKLIPTLEEKVSKLMEELDAVTDANAGKGPAVAHEETKSEQCSADTDIAQSNQSLQGQEEKINSFRATTSSDVTRKEGHNGSNANILHPEEKVSTTEVPETEEQGASVLKSYEDDVSEGHQKISQSYHKLKRKGRKKKVK